MDEIRRWWRLAPWSANPLMRGCDRSSALLTLAAMVMLLIHVPIAATWGSLMYADLSARAAHERATHRQIEVMVLDDPSPRVVPGGPVDILDHRARVEWDVAGTDRREDEISVPPGTMKGDAVAVWIDETGARTGPPTSAVECVVVGISAAAAVWLAGAVLVGSALWGLRAADMRGRMQQWDRSWRDFETGQGHNHGESV